jgi:hypothetical protein
MSYSYNYTLNRKNVLKLIHFFSASDTDPVLIRFQILKLNRKLREKNFGILKATEKRIRSR